MLLLLSGYLYSALFWNSSMSFYNTSLILFMNSIHLHEYITICLYFHLLRREGESGWGTHVNPWLIHVNVWQKPLQYCKVISLQLIKINGEKKSVQFVATTNKVSINICLHIFSWLHIFFWMIHVLKSNLQCT